MFLIIGLGNPGKKYEATRHNAGFLALEYLRDAWEFPLFRKNDSFQSDSSEGRIGSEKVFLARPLTFMNHSGEATQKIANFFKIEPKNIVVIHDDLDIPAGTIRESFDSRSAGHHGVEDIIEKLGTKEFSRLRIGIKTQTNESPAPIPEKDAATFVLEPFSENERTLIEKTFPDISTRLRARIENSPSENFAPTRSINDKGTELPFLA